MSTFPALGASNDDLDAGDLRSHVDFRDLYAPLTENVLGADPDQVIGRHPDRLDDVLA